MSSDELEIERKQVQDELGKVSSFARACILSLERLTLGGSVLLTAFISFKAEQAEFLITYTPLLLTTIVLHVAYLLFQAETHSGYAAALEERLRELETGRSMIWDSYLEGRKQISVPSVGFMTSLMAIYWVTIELAVKQQSCGSVNAVACSAYVEKWLRFPVALRRNILEGDLTLVLYGISVLVSFSALSLTLRARARIFELAATRILSLSYCFRRASEESARKFSLVAVLRNERGVWKRILRCKTEAFVSLALSRHDLTARIAYNLFIDRRGLTGSAEDDWHVAEGIVAICPLVPCKNTSLCLGLSPVVRKCTGE